MNKGSESTYNYKSETFITQTLLLKQHGQRKRGLHPIRVCHRNLPANVHSDLATLLNSRCIGISTAAEDALLGVFLFIFIGDDGLVSGLLTIILIVVAGVIIL